MEIKTTKEIIITERLESMAKRNLQNLQKEIKEMGCC
jgi:hypothetical protein